MTGALGVKIEYNIEMKERVESIKYHSNERIRTAHNLIHVNSKFCTETYTNSLQKRAPQSARQG